MYVLPATVSQGCLHPTPPPVHHLLAYVMTMADVLASIKHVYPLYPSPTAHYVGLIQQIVNQPSYVISDHASMAPMSLMVPLVVAYPPHHVLLQGCVNQACV